MNKKNLVQKLTSKRILATIQILASILLLGLVYKLGMLPSRYFLIFTVIILVLFLFTFWLMKKKKSRSSKVLVIGKLTSILLSVLMMITSFYVYKGDSFLENFGTTFETHAVSVIVLKDSKYDDLKDLKKKKFGMTSKVGGIIMANAMENIEKDLETTAEIVSADSVIDVAKLLYDKKVDAIILNEANRYMIKEEFSSFNMDTKVIYQTEIKEEIDNALKGADVTEETFTIFISGNDLFDGDEEEVKRSDVNMLVTINPKTKQILLTSVPRDTYLKLASYNGKDKLTHASIYGLPESVKTLEGFFDIEINYYFKINFTSLIKIVDALGGITVDNPIAFTNSLDAASGKAQYDFPEGKIELDGEKALIYSRERQVFIDGDNMRGRNQQRVLSAIINKASSTAIITRYSRILDSIEGAFETTLSDTQIKSFIQMQLDDMASWDIQSTQLAVTEGRSTECLSMPGYNLFVSYPVKSSIQEISTYIEKMENGELIKVEHETKNE